MLYIINIPITWSWALGFKVPTRDGLRRLVSWLVSPQASSFEGLWGLASQFLHARNTEHLY